MSKTNSNALIPTIFKSDTIGCNLRAVQDEKGEPWFVATDVAKALGYRDAPNMARRIDPEDVHYSKLSTPGGNQKLIVINESGLYAAIFGSSKKEAKAFKRFVTSEVLPSIRKHGGYMVGQDQFSEEFTHALFKHMQDTTRRALHRFDKLTENDHFTAFRNPKQAREMTEKAIVEVSEQFGLSLEMMEIIADGRHRPASKKAA